MARRTVFGVHDRKVVAQLDRCLDREEGSVGVLCADAHLGYSAPIGGVVAYREHVSPAAVGYDIGCGNMAVRTNLIAETDLLDDLAATMDSVYERVSFGMGRSDGTDADHPVIDRIREAPFEPQRALAETAAKQLGTVGAGNHYVDLFADGDDAVWVGVHFGSRGFGHKTASGFLAIAQAEAAAREGMFGGMIPSMIGETFTRRGKEGEMESPPDVLRVGTEAGDAYLEAMRLAGEYAYAGREVVVQQVLDILGAEALDTVHNHHNYTWLEEHGGETFHVVRKGATPAAPGQRGFVGATMGEPAVILEGVESPLSDAALRSTVHGAGRAMSRTKAAGKTRKRWSCQDRDCDWRQPPRTHKPEDGRCPECGAGRLRRRWVKEVEGVIDWDAATADLAGKGIELRGANAEEAPLAYKRLDEVLAEHEGTVRVLHTLRPLGVAMAPGDTHDPFKD